MVSTPLKLTIDHRLDILILIMKEKVHPQYFPAAKVKCACGKEFTVGSTKPELQVEVCYNCHPFYTGKEKMLDVAGKIDKFKARREKAAAVPKVEKKVRVAKNKKPTS